MRRSAALILSTCVMTSKYPWLGDVSQIGPLSVSVVDHGCIFGLYSCGSDVYLRAC
jgi:hypothetical protein